MPGRDTFRGAIVHPQFWPADLDCAGRKVVVIGSGATAVTLVPRWPATPAHVTMLQRSPSYIIPLPARDRIGALLQPAAAGRLSHPLIRWKNILLASAFYQYSRWRPARVRHLVLRSRGGCWAGVRRGAPPLAELRPVGPAPVHRAGRGHLPRHPRRQGGHRDRPHRLLHARPASAWNRARSWQPT
jgi:hypothetical protein